MALDNLKKRILAFSWSNPNPKVHALEREASLIPEGYASSLYTAERTGWNEVQPNLGHFTGKRKFAKPTEIAMLLSSISPKVFSQSSKIRHKYCEQLIYLPYHEFLIAVHN